MISSILQEQPETVLSLVILRALITKKEDQEHQEEGLGHRGELRMGVLPLSYHPETEEAENFLVKCKILQLENAEAGQLGLGSSEKEGPINLLGI